jgi:uncharacterized protein YcnI
MQAIQSRTIRMALAAAFALFASGSATAHIVLSQTVAAAGDAYTAYFRVGHGCAGSGTTALRIEIPDGVLGVKPQPKYGWSLKIERAPLVKPTHGEAEGTVQARVLAITWTGGPLPDDEWDEFGISATLPQTPGPIYFPTVQTCEHGDVHWTDIPAPGQDWHTLPHPAPIVTLGPPQHKEPMAGMKMGY